MIANKSRGPYFTPEEYLALERESTVKHEYRQGLVFAMAGAKKSHITIVGNVAGLFFNHFRGVDDCYFYASDVKVKFLEGEGYYYPDVAVTCNEEDRESNNSYITYPKLIVEVLSDSTEAFDRRDKFADYKTLPSLEEYVLIHQKQVLVERFLKKADNLWSTEIYREGDQVEFTSIGFRCPISFLYEKVSTLL